MTVFVDTSALYALLDHDDEAHEEAVAVLASLADRGAAVMTHDYVVVETTALVQSRLGMANVGRLHWKILPAVAVRSVPETVRQAAVAALLAANRREVSLVDWVSFEMMRLLQIEVAFAFDDHFTDQGYSLLGQ